MLEQTRYTLKQTRYTQWHVVWKSNF